MTKQEPDQAWCIYYVGINDRECGVREHRANPQTMPRRRRKHAEVQAGDLNGFTGRPPGHRLSLYSLKGKTPLSLKHRWLR
jgi:hypothetical protein